MKTILLFVLMSNMLPGACGESFARLTRVPSSTYLNVAYGPDPKQVMDIYLPEGRTAASTKIMVLIHGGGWAGGDKRDLNSYVDSLKTYLNDYAFVNINYRLATLSENKFPTQENDIKAALTYLLDRSARYSVSGKLVLLGASAGAHLALLQAYKYSEPVKARAVVSFFGPADMAYIYTHPANSQVPLMMQILMGGSPEENPANYEQSSPVNFITKETCPTLIFQGGKDPLVSPRQSALLKEKLQSQGVSSKLIVYPGEGHGWRGASLSDSFKNISEFLYEYVK